MKLSPKFISAFVAVLLAALYASCSTSNEEPVADGKKCIVHLIICSNCPKVFPLIRLNPIANGTFVMSRIL